MLEPGLILRAAGAQAVPLDVDTRPTTGVGSAYNSNDTGSPFIVERSEPCATNTAIGHGRRALWDWPRRSGSFPKRKRSRNTPSRNPKQRRRPLRESEIPCPHSALRLYVEKAPFASGAFVWHNRTSVALRLGPHMPGIGRDSLSQNHRTHGA